MQWFINYIINYRNTRGRFFEIAQLKNNIKGGVFTNFFKILQMSVEVSGMTNFNEYLRCYGHFNLSFSHIKFYCVFLTGF